MTNLLLITLVSCATEQSVAPDLAYEEIRKAWRYDQQAVWELDWPAAPSGGPLTVAIWQAGKRYRYEILESAAPALVGQILICNGQSGWRYNRFQANGPETMTSPWLSPVSDAFQTIDRLLDRSPMSATRHADTILEHGPTEKITLTFDQGDKLTVWIDQKTGLPVRLTFQAGDHQATLKARRIEPLSDPPEELFSPNVQLRR